MNQKIVVITGGSSGLGKAIAIRYASEGASVIISGRDQVKLDQTLNDLLKFHERILAVKADMSVYTDCEMLVEKTIQQFGKIDVLINNAGLSMRGLFAETNLDVIKKLMDTNFWGTVYCTKLALPYLLKSKGSVVGISSIAGKKGLPGRTGYSASKFAIEGFLETLRIENIKTGLHVLVACPGFIATGIRSASLGPDGVPQLKSPRNEDAMMSADAVAEKIIFAIKNRKRDLILTFNGKLTFWLNKFIPSIMDKMVYNHMAKESDSPFK